MRRPQCASKIEKGKVLVKVAKKLLANGKNIASSIQSPNQTKFYWKTALGQLVFFKIGLLNQRMSLVISLLMGVCITHVMVDFMMVDTIFSLIQPTKSFFCWCKN